MFALLHALCSCWQWAWLPGQVQTSLSITRTQKWRQALDTSVRYRDIVAVGVGVVKDEVTKKCYYWGSRTPGHSQRDWNLSVFLDPMAVFTWLAWKSSEWYNSKCRVRMPHLPVTVKMGKDTHILPCVYCTVLPVNYPLFPPHLVCAHLFPCL